ncbi:putative Zn-dependent protease [Opitutaceae bacterium TAV1]|nr:putative Zn-dependent protease [Opitutaceae bacterium TAV1]
MRFFLRIPLFFLAILLPGGVLAQSKPAQPPSRPAVAGQASLATPTRPQAGPGSSGSPAVVTAGPAVDIWLIPLEGFPPAGATGLQQTFSRELGLIVRVAPPVRREAAMFDTSSGQMIAARVRDSLRAQMLALGNVVPRTAFIALVGDDLNLGDARQRYVYSAHFPQQHLSVVSLARLRDAFYGTRDTPELTERRLYKITKAAIGAQYYRLPPSASLDSVMFSPVSTRYDIDRLGTGF